MKNRGDNSRWFLKLLIVSSLSIWGTIGYQFWNGTRSNDSSEYLIQQATSQTGNIYHQPIEDAFLADLTNRPNPFIAPDYKRPTVSQSKPPPAKAELSKVTPPALLVTGLLIDGNGKIAVIENQQNDARLAAAGDSLFGVRILAIGNNQVTLLYQRQEFVLEITKSD